MNLIQNFLVNNDCYKANGKIEPSFIVVHDTGADNPYISRYVQPDVHGIGENKYNNDWNKPGISKCVHAFVGKLSDGTIATCQTLPWTMRGWHAGQGRVSSMNNYAIGFEICRDINDAEYFSKVYNEAIDLCVYLCGIHLISVDHIICHHEAYEMGYASNHADVTEWFPLYGKTMDDFRKEVQNRMGIKINEPDDYAKEAWEWGKQNGLTTGERPKDTVLRQDVMLMLYKFKELEGK